MEGKGCLSNFFLMMKPYIAMICLQFGYAGMIIITKVSLNRRTSHYVLVVYRHAFATIAIAPFAIILERKVRPKITFRIFMQMFVLGLLGPVIDQNFFYAGLKFTSPTFLGAMSNILPAMTFVMAVICRMEKVHIRKLRCQAKVAGTIVTVAGATLMTLYKGDVINFSSSQHLQHSQSNVPTTGTSDKDWLKGSILLIIATFAWASFFILQAINIKDILSSSVSHNTSVFHGYPSINCCHICDGAQNLCLDNWLGHESSCCSLCWYCVIKHCILCARSSLAKKGACLCNRF